MHEHSHGSFLGQSLGAVLRNGFIWSAFLVDQIHLNCLKESRVRVLYLELCIVSVNLTMGGTIYELNCEL
jgi:hypothetical protein